MMETIKKSFFAGAYPILKKTISSDLLESESVRKKKLNFFFVHGCEIVSSFESVFFFDCLQE